MRYIKASGVPVLVAGREGREQLPHYSFFVLTMMKQEIKEGRGKDNTFLRIIHVIVIAYNSSNYCHSAENMK